MTKMNQNLLMAGLCVFAVALSVSGDAYANNFSSIASNMSDSIAQMPNLISGVSYLFGLLLAVLGIMKIKDHVENPGQTPLKDGSIRLAAGGGLFAIPIVAEAMKTTVGSGAGDLEQASLTELKWE